MELLKKVFPTILEMEAVKTVKKIFFFKIVRKTEEIISITLNILQKNICRDNKRVFKVCMLLSRKKHGDLDQAVTFRINDHI